MAQPGQMVIRANVPFRVLKAMVAASSLRTGVEWTRDFGYEIKNQAVLDKGGVIMVEGFYRKATHSMSDLETRRKRVGPSDVPE